MIARRRLLATTLAAAAAAGIPLKAAAQPGVPPADPDGTIPAPLVARGGRGRLEPGFPIGHLAVGWDGAASGNVRFRTPAGWGSWRPVSAGCTAARDPDDKRATALLPSDGALAAELDLPSGAAAFAINTTDGPRRAATRRSAPTQAPQGLPGRVRYRNRVGWEADESLAHTVTQDFGDVGYHLLVDSQGGLYEGRCRATTRCRCSARRAGGSPG